ncbi:MAG: hypothetical protein ACREMA_09540 [Longimicrobiales bacterium]
MRGPAIGLSVATLVVSGEVMAPALIGFHSTNVDSNGNGTELRVYTLPEGLAEGVLLLGQELSLVSVRPMGDGWIVSRLGFDALIAFGGGAAGMLPGIHAGLGVLLPAGNQKTAVRFEIEPHLMLGLPLYPPAFVASIGIMSLRGIK